MLFITSLPVSSKTVVHLYHSRPLKKALFYYSTSTSFFLLLHPCTQPKIKGVVSFVKLENFRHSFFILSFQPPIWYSFKLLSLPKTWDKADKDRNDRTIYNAEIFLVSIVFVDYWLSIGITIHVLLVYFSFLPPTRLLLLLLWLAIIIIIITIDVYFYLLTFLT